MVMGAACLLFYAGSLPDRVCDWERAAGRFYSSSKSSASVKLSSTHSVVQFTCNLFADCAVVPSAEPHFYVNSVH